MLGSMLRDCPPCLIIAAAFFAFGTGVAMKMGFLDGVEDSINIIRVSYRTTSLE
jgi:hypothetical protein